MGVITFNGDVIVDRTNPAVPAETMIDFENLGSNPQVFEFPLELDLSGNVANGVYTFEYSLRLDTALTPFTISSVTLPNTLVVDTTDSWLANFLEAGNSVILLTGAPATIDLVASAVFNDPDITITTSTPIASDLYTQLAFDLTNVQFNGVFTYSGCTQTTADVSFTYDCEFGDSGSWAVSNTTVLASNEVISSLNCNINYPGWATLSPTFPGNVVTTSLPYPSLPSTETPLATGTYTVSLTQQIQQNQTDGLILQYTTSTAQEFAVSCAGSLCGLTPCIENLRVAHANELHRNRISKYQVFVDNVLLYYAEAQNYRSCGDTANYRATIDLIRANLDSSGCECACCDDNVYYWVSNNSATSIIESIIESFQFRLFTLDPAAAGPPPSTANVTAGVQVGAIWENTTTNILYLCTNNAAPTPTWVEFYNYQAAVAASAVSATSGINLLAITVQGQLTQADALFTVIDGEITSLQNTVGALDGINGLTRVANDFRLGGALDAPTSIDCTAGALTLIGGGLTLNIETIDGPASRMTVEQASTNTVANNLLIETTTTGGAGANGIGAAIWLRAQDALGAVVTAGKIISTWVDAAIGNSNVQLTTKLGGAESVGFTLNPNSSITLNEYGAGTFTGDVAYGLAVDVDGNVIETTASSGPLVYVARITQTGSSVPTATVIANTTGATFTWDIIASGIYSVTASSPVLTADKTAIYVTPSSSGAYIMMAGIGSTTQCTVTSSNAFGLAGYTNGLINGAIVKIEIYP